MLRGLGRDAEAPGALEDDLGRRLYLFVRSQGRPVNRDEAALAAGVSRKLSAFHLDKLRSCPFHELAEQGRASSAV